MMQQFDEALNIKQLAKMQQGTDYDVAIWRGVKHQIISQNVAGHRL